MRNGQSSSDHLVADVVARVLERPLPDLPEPKVPYESQPRFRAAMRVAMSAVIELYEGNRLLNALATDRARFLLSILCLHLHYAELPGQPHGGLTVTRAKDICVRMGLCSPGRVTAILALMRWGGYLTPAAAGGDRRVRRLLPTERLMQLHRERWRRQLPAAAQILPELADTLPWMEHPAFTPAFGVAQAREFIGGFRVVDGQSKLDLFAERDCGLLILFAISLWNEAGRGPDAVKRPALAVSDLARRFGVSRAHVNRLLRDAELAGLLTFSARPALQVTFTPDLSEALVGFFGQLFRLNARCAIAVMDAMRRCEAEPRQPLAESA